MPIVWSADGLPAVEEPSGAEFVEVPIGVHHRQVGDTTEEVSPDAGQKAKIISSYLLAALEHGGGRTYSSTNVAIVDEVQKGGTLGTATTATRAIIGNFGLRPELRIFAAQDSRTKVSAQPKSRVYEAMASNSTPDTFTTVVPMPLIATDRATMLDTIWLEGNGRYARNMDTRLTVVRNHGSERLFRTLGSLARSPDLRHDAPFVSSFIDAQALTTMEAANRVESWMRRAVEAFDGLAAAG